MKIYHPEGSNMTVMVTPGLFHKDVSDWKDQHGNPKRFDVQFVNGVAEVDSNLGDWMIKQGQANRTGLKRVTTSLKRAFA
jgi:hypothetical protein